MNVLANAQLKVYLIMIYRSFWRVSLYFLRQNLVDFDMILYHVTSVRLTTIWKSLSMSNNSTRISPRLRDCENKLILHRCFQMIMPENKNCLFYQLNLVTVWMSVILLACYVTLKER